MVAVRNLYGNVNTNLVCEPCFNAMLVVKPMESVPVDAVSPGFISAACEKLAAAIAVAVMVPTATS